MTPFAQLGLLEKSAYQVAPPEGYDYQVNAQSGLRDPYAHYRPSAPVPEAPGIGRIAGEAALDVGLGWNPFTGVPWFGGKAINDFAHGRWGSGAMNVGMGALSFLPGAGSVAGGAKGIIGASKVGAKLLSNPAVKAMSSGAGRIAGSGAVKGLTTGQHLSGGMRTGLGVAGGGLMAGGMASEMAGGATADDPSYNPSAYKTPTGPAGDLQRTMVGAMVNNGVPPTA